MARCKAGSGRGTTTSARPPSTRATTSSRCSPPTTWSPATTASLPPPASPTASSSEACTTTAGARPPSRWSCARSRARFAASTLATACQSCASTRPSNSADGGWRLFPCRRRKSAPTSEVAPELHELLVVPPAPEAGFLDPPATAVVGLGPGAGTGAQGQPGATAISGERLEGGQELRPHALSPMRSGHDQILEETQTALGPASGHTDEPALTVAGDG